MTDYQSTLDQIHFNGDYYYHGSHLLCHRDVWSIAGLFQDLRSRELAVKMEVGRGTCGDLITIRYPDTTLRLDSLAVCEALTMHDTRVAQLRQVGSGGTRQVGLTICGRKLKLDGRMVGCSSADLLTQIRAMPSGPLPLVWDNSGYRWDEPECQLAVYRYCNHYRIRARLGEQTLVARLQLD